MQLHTQLPNLEVERILSRVLKYLHLVKHQEDYSLPKIRRFKIKLLQINVLRVTLRNRWDSRNCISSSNNTQISTLTIIGEMITKTTQMLNSLKIQQFEVLFQQLKLVKSELPPQKDYNSIEIKITHLIIIKLPHLIFVILSMVTFLLQHLRQMLRNFVRALIKMVSFKKYFFTYRYR